MNVKNAWVLAGQVRRDWYYQTLAALARWSPNELDAVELEREAGCPFRVLRLVLDDLERAGLIWERLGNGGAFYSLTPAGIVRLVDYEAEIMRVLGFLP